MDAGPEAANSVNSDDDDESDDDALSADAGKPSAEPEPTAPSADAAAADCIDELDGEDRYAVILFNRTEAEAEITAPWDLVGLDSSSARVRDLWAHEDLGVVTDEYTSAVPAHGVVMLEVTGQ
jgi:hypothetical protein